MPGHVIAALLSEIRKYGIGIVLGSQYTKQLTSAMANTRGDTLLDSVHGNVGAMVVFRLGKEDAQEMSALFWPSCGILEIVRLPNFCGYCKMSAGSQSLSPFSFRSRPLDPAGRHDQAERSGSNRGSDTAFRPSWWTTCWCSTAKLRKQGNRGVKPNISCDMPPIKHSHKY